MEQPANSANNDHPWQRYVPLAVWVGAVLLGLLIPLKILGYGYIPGDDAMCHVAKAISGKAWPEILVIRDGFGGDEHPGWHAILGAVHRWTSWDADALIGFSVAAPFFLFWLAMLAWRRRPEAWLAAAFVGSLAAPSTFVRTLFGRPFIFILIVFVLVLQLWTRAKKIPAWLLALTVTLLGVAVWVHGSWYLFGIVPVAFALAGEWRKSFSLAGCWLAGAVLGAALTGHPVGYLQETSAHLFGVFGGTPLQRMLVTELQPDPGDLIFGIVMGLALLWRVARGGWKISAVRTPLFVLAALGWLLGLQVSRFWTDWGFPAALLWLSVELEEVLEARLDYSRGGALALAGFAAAGVFIATTRDIAGRWTSDLTQEFLSKDTPDIDGWLPEKGGIVYHANMEIFFRTFYKNPAADWRYILGFEPGIMPPEDFETLRAIQLNWFAPEAYAPWVKKMRPADRLILMRDDASAPGIKELEWHRATGNLWIGRLPRGK